MSSANAPINQQVQRLPAATATFQNLKSRREAFSTRWPQNENNPPKVPGVDIASVRVGNFLAKRYRYTSESPPNRMAILRDGRDLASYPFGLIPAGDGDDIPFQGGETLVVYSVSDLAVAKAAMRISSVLGEHASEVVGAVQGNDGAHYLVCAVSGMREKGIANSGELDLDGMPDSQVAQFAAAVVMRIAKLHSQGLACGGISPDAVEFAKGEAKLLNPLRIFAFDDSEASTMFHEVAVTLSALHRGGFATTGQLEKLAWLYINHSPVCRDIVWKYAASRGEVDHKNPARIVADRANKATRIF